MKIKRIKKAFTLIEILVVLGIAAIVAAGMYIVYNQVNTVAKADAEANNLRELRTNLQTVFKSDPKGYNGINNAMLVNSGLLPKTYKVDGNTIYNSFGKTNTFESGYVVPGFVSSGKKSMVVTVHVPRKYCKDFALRVLDWDEVIYQDSDIMSEITIKRRLHENAYVESSSGSGAEILKACSGSGGRLPSGAPRNSDNSIFTLIAL